jgi:phosphatidylglycerophosphate synthase
MLARAGLALLRYLGAQPGNMEMILLRLLKAPQWEETVPNNITMARLRIGFWGVLGFYFGYAAARHFFPETRWEWVLWFAFTALLVATVFDAFDGYYARKLRCETVFGRYIDPFADKAIAWSTFLVLLHHWELAPWLICSVFVFVAYDIAVSAERGRNKQMRTNRVAKLKQFVLDTSIATLLLGVLLEPYLAYGFDPRVVFFYAFSVEFGGLMLYAALFLTAISGFIYCKDRLFKYAALT